MKHLETTFTTHDGKVLYLQAWLSSQPKASMLLVHGLGEHSSRYLHLVEKLVDIGVSVFTFDGRGHGKSADGKPTAYFDSYKDYLRDIDSLFKKVKTYVPDLPSFLYGHSMGGGMVAAYLLDYRPDTAGAILSSPAIKEAEGTSKILVAISGLISKWFPKFKVLVLDPFKISRIQEEVEKYLQDPLVYTQPIPARTGHELLKMMRSIQERASEISLPLLLIHGSADDFTNPKGSEMLAERAGSIDKTLKIFPGGYHELINDSDQDEVMDVIIRWIRERI